MNKLVEGTPNGRRNWPDQWPAPIPDGTSRLMQEVERTADLEAMSAILVADMQERAWVHADETHPFRPEAPFVVYPPMNREPEAWLAVLLAKAARLGLGINANEPMTIIGMPRSARWIPQALMEKEVFPEAMYLFATKDETEAQALRKSYIDFDVLSYAHNRLSDGRRGPETVYLIEPELLADTRVLLFEDVVAQGWTVAGIGEVISQYNPAGLYVVAPFSKGLIQGGTDFMWSCPFVDGVIELTQVSRVSGPKGLSGGNLEFAHPSYRVWQRK